MESDAKTELAELNRLEAKARAASYGMPAAAAVFLIVSELALVSFLAMSHWSLPAIAVAGWWAFCIAFIVVLRLRRPARPRRLLATPAGRRRLAQWLGVFLLVNAVWQPLWFWNRGLAATVLVLFLLGALVYNAGGMRNARRG